MRTSRNVAAWLAVGGMLLAGTAWAQHTMTGNLAITNASQVWTLSDTSITGSGYVWQFPDANGLNMAGYTVSNCYDAGGFTLDLGGGSLTNNGTLTTSRGATTGSITVTNVSTVALNSISTYETVNNNYTSGCVNLYGNNSGALAVSSISTKQNGNLYPPISPAGIVTIVGFTNVTVSGSIDASAQSLGAGCGGGVFIGSASRPIGGSITIGGDILTGTLNAKAGGMGLSLYCSNAIQVGNLTLSPLLYSSGNLNVSHKGSFRAASIVHQSVCGNGCVALISGGDQSGPFTVNGSVDLTIGSAAASALVTNPPSLAISNYASVTIAGSTITKQYRTSNSPDAGAISIGNISGSVTMGDIDASNAQASRNAGNVAIATSGGNITIGSPSLDGNAGSAADESYDRDLTLSAPNGTITMATLDINKVRTVSLSSTGSSTKNYILGQLLNFPIASPSASLLTANNGSGIVYYNSSVPANQYLGGSTYSLGGGNGQLQPLDLQTLLTAVNWSSTSSTDFERGANWGGTAPANDTSSSVATFGAKGSYVNPALSTNRSVGGLNFTAAGWTLGGSSNTLTLGGGGIDSAGAGNNTVAANLAVPAAPGGGLWNIGSGNTLDLQGVVSGDGYIEKSGAGTLQLSTNNSFSGQLGIDAGVLNVAASNALAAAKLYTFSGSTVNFLTPTAALGSLGQAAGTGGGTIYLGNPGNNDCVLTLGGDNSTSANTAVIANASGRFGSIVKAGTGTLTLKANSTYTGTTTLGVTGTSGGGIALADGGQLSATTALEVGYGSALTLDNTGSANNNDRLNAAASVILRNGTLSLLGRSATASSESVGTVTLTNGFNTINVSTGGASGTATLTLAGLVRAVSNGVVNFTGTGLGGNGNFPRVQITGQSASPFLGPWAIVGGANWAKYDATVGVTNFLASDYLATTCTTWTSSSHVLLSQNNKLFGPASNNTLKCASASYGIDLNGNVLDIYGGILDLGNNAYTMISQSSGAGYVTAGDPSTGGELVILSLNTGGGLTTISAPIQDNNLSGSSKPVSLTLAGGNGTAWIKLSSANNTFSGGCTLNGSLLALGNAANVLGTGPFTINGGLLGAGGVSYTLANSQYIWNGDFQVGHANATGSPIIMNGGPVLVNRNVTVNMGSGQSITLTVTNTVANNYDLTLVSGANANNFGMTLSAPVSGTGRLICGSATTPFTSALVLNGANTYTGGTVLNSGWLRVGNATALGNSAGALTINGGTLDATATTGISMTGNNPQTWNNSFSFLSSGPLSMGNGPVTLTTNVTISMTAAGNTYALTENGSIGGNYGITLAGTYGMLTLAAANTFSGAMTVSGSTLKLTNEKALQFATLTPAGGAITFDSTVASRTFTVGGLAGSGNLALKDNAATPNGVTLVVSNTADTVYAGVLSENDLTHKGSLIKLGTGMLTLSRTNTYTGPTTVSNGTLLVNGGLGTGRVVVVSGAAFGGSGTINGVVTNAGTLAAGGVGSVATLTLATNLVMQSGAAISWERSATTNDIISVNGNLTLGAGNTYTVRLGKVGTVTSPQGDYTLIQYAGADPADIGNWTVDAGTTGWSAKVVQGTGGRLLLRFMPRGTTVLFW